MEKITISVEGMSCTHCEKRVEQAVKRVRNVINARVDFRTKSVEIAYEGEIDQNEVRERLKEEGYEVIWPTR